MADAVNQLSRRYALRHPSGVALMNRDATYALQTVSKNRYQLTCPAGDHTDIRYIRAIQAHGVGLKIDDASLYRPLDRAETPPLLYHCTSTRCLAEIAEHGLIPGGGRYPASA